MRHRERGAREGKDEVDEVYVDVIEAFQVRGGPIGEIEQRRLDGLHRACSGTGPLFLRMENEIR